MSTIFNKPTGIAYFDELESPAFSSVQTVWDRISVNRMGTKFVTTSFNKDMLSLGYPRPSEKDINRLIAAIEAGSIDRPERGGDTFVKQGQLAVQETPVTTVLSEEVLSVAVPAEKTLVTEAPTEPASPDPVATLRDRMMVEALAELQGDIEQQARKLVAIRLRGMADAFERGEV
jgi:hypothetical protein